MFSLLLLCFLFFFFFKQKTAYEMRISDWSSDVCSSDLLSVVSYSLQDLVLSPLHRPRIADSPGRARGMRREQRGPAAATIAAAAGARGGDRGDRKSVV